MVIMYWYRFLKYWLPISFHLLQMHLNIMAGHDVKDCFLAMIYQL